jgi:acetyltransferase-like isoleucine patch superfamily enzyme
MLTKLLSRLRPPLRILKRRIFPTGAHSSTTLERYAACGWARIGENCFAAPEASITITALADGRSLPALVLGSGVRIGRRASLDVMRFEVMRIGGGTSIQEGCSLLGDVAIGEECLLSKNVFISSGNHHYDLNPPLFIRDQDQLASDHVGQSAPVTIDDDCWIGWGVFIKRGVHVGKGAILGAYSVVTRDVEPYSIHVGAPNRCLKHRLLFRPPALIRGGDLACIPYFYSGFALRLSERISLEGVDYVAMRESGRLVLAQGAFDSFRLAGRLINGAESGDLQVRSNLFHPAKARIEESTFDLTLPCSPRERPCQEDVPSFLQDYCLVNLHATGADREGRPVSGSCLAISLAAFQ